jgi:hypothetical protein
LHLHPVDIIFNPIVDTLYRGGFGSLEFVPATRLAYNVNDKWAVAVEEYADLGPLRHFDTVHNQFHEIWAVMDHNGKTVNIEARRWNRCDCRGRQVDFQADAVARSELSIQEFRGTTIVR